jgi:lipid II:glycine glycyltransferase (peptidoglycan interpeptide bridge formation enzyme)
MLKLTGIFPGKYKFFSVSNGKDIIAATICVHVNRRVLYNFLPAHDEMYKKFSPVVYLMHGIHHYAQNEKFKLIDLGISSVHGKPQTGLIKFKERLGGKAISKLTFVKEIL